MYVTALEVSDLFIVVCCRIEVSDFFVGSRPGCDDSSTFGSVYLRMRTPDVFGCMPGGVKFLISLQRKNQSMRL